MNQLFIGSSETTREIWLTQFNFKHYETFGTPQHKPKIDTFFLEWFIGFFEAEGCLLKWPYKNGKNRFGIEITQKDPQLMYKIRTRLGFGRVVKYSLNTQTYWRYYVHDLKNVIRLIWLFNGNFITEKKREQFKIWIYDINVEKNQSFGVLKPTSKISVTNGWLSGFFEGDAGFWVKPNNIIRINKDDSRSYNIKMKFYITQKNETKLLNDIRGLFHMPWPIYEIQNQSLKKYNRLETGLLQNHLLISEYLTKYPFLGKRYILFHRWKRVLGYRINKYPITKKSIIKLKRLILSTKQIFL
jgi:LAGLIDADG endonuclease